jgi:hypothetical protein
MQNPSYANFAVSGQSNGAVDHAGATLQLAATSQSM